MFNIGDQVVIREDSQYYGKNNKYNPDNSVVGIVISDKYSLTFTIDGIYRYYVDWVSGYKMPYREQDLELAANPDINDWL